MVRNRSVALCNKSEITNVVCASSPATNVNPFAMVCATAISGTLATVQQTFCGNTPRTALRNNGCDGLLDGLCTGIDTLRMVGAVNYNCADDTTTNVAAARNLFCATPATAFTAGCLTDGTHDGTHGKVADAQNNFCANDCDERQYGLSTMAVIQQRFVPIPMPRPLATKPFATLCGGNDGITATDGTGGGMSCSFHC